MFNVFAGFPFWSSVIGALGSSLLSVFVALFTLSFTIGLVLFIVRIL